MKTDFIKAVSNSKNLEDKIFNQLKCKTLSNKEWTVKNYQTVKNNFVIKKKFK